MEVLHKNRASRNRTLTVSSEEVADLQSQILYPHDIKSDTIYANRLINADIFHVIDYIPDESANLIIIDPPYNLTKNFNSSTFAATSDKKYEEYLRSWFPKICAKLAPNGSLYMCGDWKCSYIQQKVISEYLTILNRITWQREKGRGATSNWKNGMEDIWFAVKSPKDYYFNVDAVKMKRRVVAPYKENGKPKDWEVTSEGNIRVTYPSNFWDDISIPFWSMPENTDHPTQKSEKLIAKLVLASSKPGDLVFDPFVGSGTTCVTAKKLGRKYLGVEIDEDYCLWGAKRLQQADNDPEIQGYSGGYFWERNSLNLQKVRSITSNDDLRLFME
ncbi:MAG: site-specific DNA-methyltransferase [Alistipes sp.]|nr:site-specific DNA-methyltransferase [Alistipes sp.]